MLLNHVKFVLQKQDIYLNQCVTPGKMRRKFDPVILMDMFKNKWCHCEHLHVVKILAVIFFLQLQVYVPQKPHKKRVAIKFY